MTDVKNLYMVDAVVGARVEPWAILKAFGIERGQGTVKLGLSIKADDFVELTVTRYVTQAELDQLYAALEAEPPVDVMVKAVVNHGKVGEQP
jgi:hypothetical protein